MDPRLIEEIMDRSRPGWRQRREKRKSPWNLLCVLLGFAISVPTAIGLFKLSWNFHVLLYPAHSGRLKEFWQPDISLAAFIPSAMMTFPLIVPTIVVSFLIANRLVWFIPPARKAMEAEAEGDPELTFVGAQMGLLKWGGLLSLVAAAISCLGAIGLAELK